MRSRVPLVFVVLASMLFVCLAAAAAQTPQPFPRPSAPASPPGPSTAPPGAVPQTPAPVQPSAAGEPTEASLGLPIYPGAQFLASYDAGRAQRYFLFGVNAGFPEVVNYYKTALKQKGDLVFDEPATHMFEVGRYREETMAFPPGVTVKDYTWGGGTGYPNPKRGAEPARFKTVIQLVPVPPGAPAR